MAVQAKARQQTVGRETEQALGRGVAIGRNGEQIRRARSSSSDPYHIPDLISAKYAEEGFKLQWCAISVLGKDDPAKQAKNFNDGWRPVPADRHPGVWLPPETKGDIVIGGLRLEERPTKLDDEARAEERQMALEQVNGSREQFGFAPTARGFEGADKSNSPHVRKNTFVRREMVHVDDAPRPKYEVSLDD